MIKMRYFIAFMLLFCTNITFAQVNTEEKFKELLEVASQKNKTIECNFTQTKKIKNIRQPIIADGRFYYDNNRLMAMIYNTPKGDKVIMSQDSFTVIAGGKKMVSESSSNPMMAQISYMMQACMSGDVTKLGRGWDMDISEQSLGYMIKITPTDRRVQKYVNAMLMYFDKSDLTLDKLRIEERNDCYTEYEFKNKQLNGKLDKSVFNIE